MEFGRYTQLPLPPGTVRSRRTFPCKQISDLIYTRVAKSERCFFSSGADGQTKAFWYEDEIEEIIKLLDGRLEVIMAYLRTQAQKVYVQGMMEERGEQVAEMLQGDASFYVYGSASMAREVQKQVGEIMKRRNGWDDTQLKAWSEKAKRINR